MSLLIRFPAEILTWSVPLSLVPWRRLGGGLLRVKNFKSGCLGMARPRPLQAEVQTVQIAESTKRVSYDVVRFAGAPSKILPPTLAANLRAPFKTNKKPGALPAPPGQTVQTVL
jgi:hypothetical protein